MKDKPLIFIESFQLPNKSIRRDISNKKLKEVIIKNRYGEAVGMIRFSSKDFYKTLIANVYLDSDYEKEKSILKSEICIQIFLKSVGITEMNMKGEMQKFTLTNFLLNI